ncbi:MAG TPA: MFS transporter [Allosphingosinicella sp.]|jgi:EmrB/QacA subfamily drug resistance transporter|nr:MFS transporter [Allosphingosinicella sp.]
MSGAATAECDRGIAAGARHRPCHHDRAILAATILASSLSFVDGSVVNVALPAIGHGLGANGAALQWVVNAYLLPLSALLLLGGAAGDRFGRRRLFVGGIILFTAASLLCAVAPALPVLIAGRTLQGIGSAMLMPNSLSILGSSFSGEARGRAIGAWAAAGAVAGALGPLAGGWLVDAAGWRFIFLINLPIAAGAIWLGLRFVPTDRKGGGAGLDWTGAALATLGLAGISWALTVWTAGLGRGQALWSGIMGAAALLLFVLAEARKGERALMPLGLFATRSFVGLSILTLLLYGALGGLFVALPWLLIQAGGYSAAKAGAALLPLPAVIAFGSRAMGALAARIGPRWPLTIGPLIVAAGFLLGTRIDPTASYWTTVLPPLLLVAMGMAGAVAPLTTAVMASTDAHHVGAANGFNSALARTGGLLATALLGGLLARHGAAVAGPFAGVSLAGAILAAGAGLAILLLYRSPDARHPHNLAREDRQK